MVREEILFLTHRIPYPPDKGDKIRSWNVLSALAAQYTTHLACFIDNPRDWQHRRTLRELCGECYFAGLQPNLARLRSLTGFVTGDPLTLAYYRHRSLNRWVQDLYARRPVKACYVFSTGMAQFVASEEFQTSKRIMDFVDVDSEKWREYGRHTKWPVVEIYRREAEKLLGFEKTVAKLFDHCLFATNAELELFRTRMGFGCGHLGAIRNGVDTRFFSPERSYPNPYPADHTVLLMTGAMDYKPNVDAAVWFASNVMPKIRAEIPEAVFVVVGSDPVRAVRRLNRLSYVKVTGRVSDIRPYLAHAHAAVAPLSIARGVQNKVLEAMAMALPVIASPVALEGLETGAGCNGVIASDTAAFAETTIKLLRSPDRKTMGRDARLCALSNYQWGPSLLQILSLLEDKSGSGERFVAKG